MSTDVLSQLRAVDPGDVPVAAPEDLLATLVAEPLPARATAPRRTAAPRIRGARRGVVLAGGCAAVAAAAIVALPGGSATSDARAALIAAADRTAGATSGVVTLRTVTDPPIGDFHTDNTMVTTFDGDDTATTFTPGGEHAGPAAESRKVGDRLYSRDPDGTWSETIVGPDRPETGGSRLTDQLGVAGSLADLARQAPAVTRESRDDATIYHVSIDAAALPQYRLGGPQWPAGPVSVDVTVGSDGNVRETDLHVPSQRWDVSFSHLGEPQSITAPAIRQRP